MTDVPFTLGTFAWGRLRPFVGLVVGDRVVEIGAAETAYRAAKAGGSAVVPAHDMNAILAEWDRHFDIAREIVAYLFDGTDDLGRISGSAHDLRELRVCPPVMHPSKILNSAANYSGHLAEMRDYNLKTGTIDAAKIYKGDKAGAEPYLFLKAPSALIGAYDDIVLPSATDQIDWEAELAVVIGPQGRRIPAAKALDHVAGFMTFNDVSCRNRLFRKDRENFRTDWLSSKSFDSFAPAGPFLVPRAFVPDNIHLRLSLWVNGELKQDGMAGDMIFSPEEQIAYASTMMTLMPGDIFATGTLGGVGQASGTFLKAGDVVETEIHGIGRQRNAVVLEQGHRG